jgi:phosphatidylserine/phosphatidylglycerophosphate/cardiolipin synthase-like enzyme
MSQRTRLLLIVLAVLVLLAILCIFLVLRTSRQSTSGSTPGQVTTPPITEHLNTMSDSLGAINVYFNKSALPAYALPNNQANYYVNLEQRLLRRIRAAQHTIDLATYEINLSDIIAALVERAAQGVQVRVIADAKDDLDPEYAERYRVMRCLLEQLVRGADLKPGTADDCALLADSPLFAVEDDSLRQAFGLPSECADLPQASVTIGRETVKGRLLAWGERKKRKGSALDQFYTPNQQMHNKFVIIDNEWVWTGSWNFTVSSLYGTAENQHNGIVAGNIEHSVEVHSPELAAVYRTEFEEMWGAPGRTPNPMQAAFHARKKDNTRHTLTVGRRKVESYFSPGDNAVDRMVRLVEQEAQQRVYFEIFAWSSQALTDALKRKWESSGVELTGTRTGFDIRGIFDNSFWDQWWSASIDMTGRSANRTSAKNPIIRWRNPAPVYPDADPQKLHAKTMLIDPDTDSDPTVVVGSTNWSANGEDYNDENLLIIHDRLIANQFLQEFYARYREAGGAVPEAGPAQNSKH